MAAKYELFIVSPSMYGSTTIIEPDLALNAQMGIKSDFDCTHCGKGIGISWKQGISDGMIVKCPSCKIYNEFVRTE